MLLKPQWIIKCSYVTQTLTTAIIHIRTKCAAYVDVCIHRRYMDVALTLQRTSTPTSNVQVEAVGGDVAAQVVGRALVPAGVLHGDGVEEDGAVLHRNSGRRVVCTRGVRDGQIRKLVTEVYIADEQFMLNYL